MALDAPGVRLLALSGRMRKAAEHGAWEEVARLDEERRMLAAHPGAAAQLGEAVKIGEGITALAAAARAEVAERLAVLQRSRRAAAAYDSER